ncbi:M48 family metalloprotease [Pseudaquabacterium rugosum]|uniref:M48 family metalloprotease n=1 Tax=Pseudaquabacterium rugosum TaxID=2984194 RepID=A0ABU9BFI9_9BURK
MRLSPRPPSRLLRLTASLMAMLTGLTGSPGSLAQGTGTARTAVAPRLPALGDAAVEDLGPGAERRLGEQVMREVRQDPDYLDDPVLGQYVAGLWQPLVEAARRRGDIGTDTDTLFAWETFLVRDRSVNAFALPGGHVGVHLGLIAMTPGADELASVLAHELAHVTQHHIARRLSASSRNQTVSMAAMLLAILAASRSSGNLEAANAAIVGSQAATLQADLNFSRDMEREADRQGDQLLREAGYAPDAMSRMFDRLDQANRLNDNGAYPYLRSHPLTTERIGEARQRLQAEGLQGAEESLRSTGRPDRGEPPAAVVSSASAASAISVPPAVHALMRARARVLMDSSPAALERQLALALTTPRDGALATGDALATLSAGATAGMRLRQFDRARSLLAQARQGLAATSAADPAGADLMSDLLILQQAELEVAAGQPEAAGTVLAGLRQPRQRAAMLLRAQQAEALPDAREAAWRASLDELQLWTSQHGGDATAWHWQAQLAQRLGQPLRALRAQAENRAALGDLRGAVDRLSAAQRQARGDASRREFIEATVIDARLRELTAELRSLRREAEGGRP